MLTALSVLAFVLSVAAPFIIERGLHRWGTARLARLAFVPVGTRRLLRVNQRIDTTSGTYRGGAVRRRVLVPAGAWTLAGPNGGTVQVAVEPSREAAVVRMAAATRSGPGQHPSVTATLRIAPAREGDAHVLRAFALPEGLAFALGLPIAAIWWAVHTHDLAAILIACAIAVGVTASFQLQWWLSHGALVRESAAIALVAIAGEIETEAAPTPSYGSS